MKNRTTALISTTGIAILAAAAIAEAAPPTPHQLSIAAKPTRVVYGGKATISGQLTGSNNAGETVTLDQDPYPFGAFNKLDTTTTSSTGAYSFTVAPTVNTKYQATAKSHAPATSSVVEVKVAPKVTITVNDKTPAKGQTVTFRGRVTPAHDGQPIRLQRQSGDHWKTVVTVTLLHGTADYSKYVVTRKITRNGTFRVLKPHDADHAYGKSRKLHIKISS